MVTTTVWSYIDINNFWRQTCGSLKASTSLTSKIFQIERKNIILLKWRASLQYNRIIAWPICNQYLNLLYRKFWCQYVHRFQNLAAQYHVKHVKWTKGINRCKKILRYAYDIFFYIIISNSLFVGLCVCPCFFSETVRCTRLKLGGWVELGPT